MASRGKASVGGEDERYFSRAVAKALQMLDLLNDSDKPINLNEMASRVELTKTSAYRLLHTLQMLHFVEQGRDGMYVLGGRGRVDTATRIANALRGMALTPVAELYRSLDETVSVAVLFSNHVEVVRVFESTRIVRMVNTEGRIISPHASSLGKAITASQSKEVQRHLLLSYGLTRFTPQTIVDQQELEREFEKTRNRGFSLEDEESTPDGFCIGVPLTLTNGRTIGGMSASFPKSRMPTEERRDEIVAQLKAASEGLCATLQDSLPVLS